MDGQWQRLLASGILLGIVGCGSTGGKTPAPPVNTAEPPLSSSAKPEKRGKNDPIKLETLLAFANTYREAAALPDRSERDRESALAMARARYEEVLKRDANNLEALLGMARCCKIAQDRTACLDWYQRATKASPKNAQVWGEMGQALDGLQDRDTAIQCYHKATQLDAKDKNYSKALGLALCRAGRYQEGYAWLSRCMTPAEAHVCVGRMMDHNGHPELAYQQFDEALRADPNNETARLALSNASVPNDGIPLVTPTPIQTVSYQQVTPMPRTPAPQAQPAQPVAPAAPYQANPGAVYSPSWLPPR
jgi:tetratricopeptide (TPR) repeat protein